MAEIAWTGPSGPDDEVRVLGHEDERPEREIPHHPRPLDRLGEPAAGPLGGEELIAVIARECQLMGVPGLVEGTPTSRSVPMVHDVQRSRRLRRWGLEVETPATHRVLENE